MSITQAEVETYRENVQNAFDNRILEEVITTKRVSASGGALKISITSECNALGVGVGDYIEVTIRKASRRN